MGLGTTPVGLSLILPFHSDRFLKSGLWPLRRPPKGPWLLAFIEKTSIQLLAYTAISEGLQGYPEITKHNGIYRDITHTHTPHNKGYIIMEYHV